MSDETTRKQRLKIFLQTKYNWFDNNLFISNWESKSKIKEEIYSNNILKNFNNENINTTQQNENIIVINKNPLSAKSTPTTESVHYWTENCDSFYFKCTNVKKSNNNFNVLINAIDLLIKKEERYRN